MRFTPRKLQISSTLLSTGHLDLSYCLPNMICLSLILLLMLQQNNLGELFMKNREISAQHSRDRKVRDQDTSKPKANVLVVPSVHPHMADQRDGLSQGSFIRAPVLLLWVMYFKSTCILKASCLGTIAFGVMSDIRQTKTPLVLILSERLKLDDYYPQDSQHCWSSVSSAENKEQRKSV